MKVRLLILLFGFSLIGHSFGQDLIKETSQTPQEIYDFHMKKSKALATAGAITLVAGPAMMVGGFFISFDFMSSECDAGCKFGTGLAVVGFMTLIASPILFINAGEHKKKAKIQLQNGAVGLNNEIEYYGISISYSF